ncbi:MAG: molybdopterin-dependent oxidoreductase alpha subunit [Lentisphaeria bacterium]|jgi:molybdopterin-dependent oxidoreductase alpha subunit
MAIIGGGFKAIRSVLSYAAAIGPINLYRSVRSKNACKACAFGTGGQQGGLHNETRKGIEICNKNIQAHTSDIRPGIAAQFFFENSVADLSKLSGRQLEALGRLATPLYKKAGDSHYSPLSYDKAIDLLAAAYKATTPDKTFFYASGRSSNEAAFSLQLLARLYGTNNVNNCSYYCHQASGVGLSETVGTSTATIDYDDLGKADMIFVFGANPASNHPRYLKTLIKCRRRGGKVIVINPAREPGMVRFASPSDLASMLKGGENIASTYIQPHIGGDIALMQGMIKALIERSLCDQDFIAQNTQGFNGYAESVAALQWQDIVEGSGVTQFQIEDLAEQYGKAQHAVLSWSMGLTHHLHGVANIQTLVALALCRGMVGKPGAGLLPLRGHSNIQGTGSMGFSPVLKAEVEQKLSAQLNVDLPQAKGMDTMACMEAAAEGKIDVALMLGGNLLASNPDTMFATGALNNIPFKCYINSTLNLGHVNGVDKDVLILPIKVRDEEDQATTQESMFNFVRMSDGGIKRFPQLKSETDIICTLGEQLIDKTRFDFGAMRNHKKVRSTIEGTVPGFKKIGLIDASAEEFHIEGRILHQPTFNTTSQKAQFIFHTLPPRDSDSLYLTTVRSEGQFNSIIYHEQDSYRGQTRRDVVLINPDDMTHMNLKENMVVDLVSATGCLSGVSVKPFDVRRGNIITYYPEANVLVPKAIDGASKTPAFKSIPIKIVVNS